MDLKLNGKTVFVSGSTAGKAKGSYPANPSVIKKTDMAPAGEDFIMWDDNFSRAKSFTF